MRFPKNFVPRMPAGSAALVGSLLLAVGGGCGGVGAKAEYAPPEPTQIPPSLPKGGVAKNVNGEAAGSTDRELVTPNRKVDPKALVDVVREEVKGGEADSGGTPENYLWLAEDASLIRDEPLTIDAPRPLPPLVSYVPKSNPLTKGRVALGGQLFFDPRVSLNGTVSCATCHNPDKGWTDNLRTSVGIDGQVGARNAPTVLNTAYGRTMFWDGRSPSLEGQAQGPIQNTIEMGKQSYKEIVERLRGIPGYRDQFRKTFGTDVTLDGMAKAIASFERVAALSGNSAYDRYDKGDMTALSESAKRGMVLFGFQLHQDDEFQAGVPLKKANCTSCHAGFNFTDEQFHNLGIGWNVKDAKFADLGRSAITPVGAKDSADDGAFKTPTCRDIAETAPYMHDGSLQTLEEVVEHYNKGGTPNPSLDDELRDFKDKNAPRKLNLSDGEKADLVAFLKSLTGRKTKVTLPTLPPGPDGKSPDPTAALSTPGPKTAGAASTLHRAVVGR